jgi:hypothetical protein
VVWCGVGVGFSIPGTAIRCEKRHRTGVGYGRREESRYSTPDYGIITPRDNFPGKIGLLDRLIFSIRTRLETSLYSSIIEPDPFLHVHPWA